MSYSNLSGAFTVTRTSTLVIQSPLNIWQ